MTSRRVFQITGGLLLAAALTGCEASKSSNPTAPTVAGPIPGVNISAPGLIEPLQGFKFKENEQPIRLVVQNSSSSGVRPLSYTFEVAADSGFGSKVYSRSGVAPGENNRTSVQIDRLEIGRAYYWRAWAEDGANTGAVSTAGFEIYPKPAVNPPAALSPVNNETVGNATPTLRVRNATWVGPVGGLRYEFQIATDQPFTKLAYAGFANEGAGDTTFNSAGLPPGTAFFWRSRASDGESTSGWSATQGFRTPAAPTPPAPGPNPPPGGGGGSCASTNGLFIVQCIGARYPERLRPVGSLGERQHNMEFIRDRVIEAGKCGGMDLGQNLKRGGPDLSIDFLVHRRAGGDMGVDIAFDYDNISTTLVLTWGEAGFGATYKPYPAVNCAGI